MLCFLLCSGNEFRGSSCSAGKELAPSGLRGMLPSRKIESVRLPDHFYLAKYESDRYS